MLFRYLDLEPNCQSGKTRLLSKRGHTGVGNHDATTRLCLDPLMDLYQILVLLALVIRLTHIDSIDHWFGGQQHVVVEVKDILLKGAIP